MSTIALAMFTDGRYHVFDEQRIASWDDRLHGTFAYRYIFNDAATIEFHDRLAARFPDWTIMSWHERMGFGGTIRGAWAALAKHDELTHVFHLEDDFELAVDVELDVLAGALDRHPHLVQLALRRQPWNDVEIEAGGIVECNPGCYDESGDEYLRWLEHRLFFTTNPSMYRASLCRMGWPTGELSEGHFTHQLLRDGSPEVGPQHVRFAFYGGRHAGVQVNHIGTQRAGTGY